MKIKIITLSLILCLGIISCSSFISGFADSLGRNAADRLVNPPSNNSSGGGTQQSQSQAPVDPNRRAAQDTANWNIAALDTAANANYLTGIEKDVILEMNKVRSNPRRYAELYIQPRLPYYSGRNYSAPGQITIVTQEGIAAARECINALNAAGSAGLLFPDRGLSLASKDHVADQNRTGQVGHYGSDRSDPEVRASRYGRLSGAGIIGENILYGGVSGREIVVELLIDDGVPNRGHRISILNGTFTQTGAGFGSHPRYGTSCTIKYAAGYSSN